MPVENSPFRRLKIRHPHSSVVFPECLTVVRSRRRTVVPSLVEKFTDLPRGELIGLPVHWNFDRSQGDPTGQLSGNPPGRPATRFVAVQHQNRDLNTAGQQRLLRR